MHGRHGTHSVMAFSLGGDQCVDAVWNVQIRVAETAAATSAAAAAQHARAEARCKSSQRTRDHQLAGAVSFPNVSSLATMLRLTRRLASVAPRSRSLRRLRCRGSVRHVGWSLLIVSRMPAPMQW